MKNQTKEIDTILNSTLKNSFSYDYFIELMIDLVQNNSTTGDEKTESLINYTKLNERRFRRWDKTLKLSENATIEVESFKKRITWLVITESWCGDAAHVMPVINKIAGINDKINLKVVLRDQNKELMDQFLTNGSKSIPKLIMIDNESGKVLKTYGPRPSEATKLVDDYKSKYGKLSPEFKEDLQRWYNKNKGQNIINDLVDLLK